MGQRVLIIGIGNTLRRDDGAGCFLAEALAASLKGRGLDVATLLVQQLTPELAEEIADSSASTIFFADVAADATTAQVTPLLAPDDFDAAGDSHHLAPDLLMAIAQRLYGVSTPAWLVTVPGVDFGHGEGLSQAAQRGIHQAQAIVQNSY